VGYRGQSVWSPTWRDTSRMVWSLLKCVTSLFESF
jgi:hypothetical protein